MKINLALPHYDLKLPSTGKKVTIRPFTVKEEKILLMAAESDDTNEIINTTKQIVSNCIIGDSFDVDKLPFFDVDYLFIALRAKSIGESVEVKFTCNAPWYNPDDEKFNRPPKECGNIFSAAIDISNCEIEKNEKIKDTIRISNNLTVKMKYPNYETMKRLNDDDNEIDRKIDIIVACIEMITDGDNVYTTKDMTKKEMRETIENLTMEQFKRFEEYVDNFPSFAIKAKAKCPKCGFEHELEYREFTSFFD